ncbi:metal ABC transporter permease [Ornithinicoccus hortensis]|uniref:Zinc transport system permease protein n=1 Tax=Ornithinicoccus hortensis TaxID=82346 RepID=A0A542YS64_9MICO|nr:metal ABC transporter permease [Ornithinicoccus hortensis]TQL50891.1 zinc transport system permease protein [Ornithinicoccus hortensis]
MAEILSLDFMRNALLAALLVGAAAPLVGIFLVQRRLSLIGDGMGHVALAGVAIGVFLDTQPLVTAMAAAVFAGVAIEVIRARGRTSGDIALAVMFYGGIAAGVVIINRVDGSQTANLTGYLFGAITTTSGQDLVVFGVLCAVIMGVTLVLHQRLFAVAGDEEYARASGLPVMALNITLSVLTAVTVVVSMRVVGLLLISALMIVPNAAAQQVARSFRTTMVWAVAFGVLSSVGGVVTSFYADTAAGGTIVLLAIAVFLAVAGATGLARAATKRAHRVAERHPHEHGPGCGHRAVPHGDHVDYLHGEHRHAPHGAHYDEHGEHTAYPGDTGATDDPSEQEQVTR